MARLGNPIAVSSALIVGLVCVIGFHATTQAQDGWQPRFRQVDTPNPMTRMRREEERVAKRNAGNLEELPRQGIVVLETPEPDGEGQSNGNAALLNDPNASGFEPRFGDGVPPDGVVGELALPGVYGCADRALKPNKDGFFQRLGLNGTWLYRDNEPSDLGITEVETFVTVAVPLPTREWPLVISPTYQVRFLEGPETTDLPPRLHSAYVDFIWLPQFTERFSGIVAVRPGIFSDFEKVDGDAMRIMGAGLLRYSVVPNTLDVLAGVAYLNRRDISLLPVGGLIWTPNRNVRYEILLPRPKLAHRIGWGCGYEDWLYVAGELGGGTWEIERFNGTVRDQLTLQDLRVMIGWERKRDGGAGVRLELGYVFNRKVEFATSPGTYEPAETFLARGGVVF